MGKQVTARPGGHRGKGAQRRGRVEGQEWAVQGRQQLGLSRSLRCESGRIHAAPALSAPPLGPTPSGQGGLLPQGRVLWLGLGLSSGVGGSL